MVKPAHRGISSCKNFLLPSSYKYIYFMHLTFFLNYIFTLLKIINLSTNTKPSTLIPVNSPVSITSNPLNSFVSLSSSSDGASGSTMLRVLKEKCKSSNFISSCIVEI